MVVACIAPTQRVARDVDDFVVGDIGIGKCTRSTVADEGDGVAAVSFVVGAVGCTAGECTTIECGNRGGVIHLVGRSHTTEGDGFGGDVGCGGALTANSQGVVRGVGQHCVQVDCLA